MVDDPWRSGSRKGLCVLLPALAALNCATATHPAPEQKAPAAPVLFVQDPVDLLPDMQAVLHMNTRRLRSDPQVFELLMEAAVSALDDPDEVRRVQRLAQHVEAVLVGATTAEDGETKVIFVIRTAGQPIMQATGGQAFFPEVGPGPFGMLWGKSGDTEAVLVDDLTLVIFDSSLRTPLEALLSRGPARRFKDEPAFRGLAAEVAFGAAPMSVLGSLPPDLMGHMGPSAGDSGNLLMRALTRALRGVHSWGGQLDLNGDLFVRVVARGQGSSQMGMLAGAIMMMKTALAQNPNQPALAKLAEALKVEVRGEVLELSYQMPREEAFERLRRWLSRGEDEDPKPDRPAGSEI